MVYVSVTYNQSMSPSDLHLLIHFRQRWAKHDPCLLSVKAAFFSIWQNFSTDPREAESTPIQHPCKTCLVTALEEEVAFEHPSFWCLPSAWKVTATSKRNSPSHLGRVAHRNLVGRPSFGTSNEDVPQKKPLMLSHLKIVPLKPQVEKLQ